MHLTLNFNVKFVNSPKSYIMYILGYTRAGRHGDFFFIYYVGLNLCFIFEYFFPNSRILESPTCNIWFVFNKIIHIFQINISFYLTVYQCLLKWIKVNYVFCFCNFSYIILYLQWICFDRSRFFIFEFKNDYAGQLVCFGTLAKLNSHWLKNILNQRWLL